MKKCKTEFVIEEKQGVVTKIDHSVIFQPKTAFKGGTVKWYPDKKKTQ